MYYYKKPEEVLKRYTERKARRTPWWSRFLLPVNLVLLVLAFWIYHSRVGGNPIYLKDGVINLKVLKSGALQIAVTPKRKFSITQLLVEVSDGNRVIFSKEFPKLTFKKPKTLYVNFSEVLEKTGSRFFEVKVSFFYPQMKEKKAEKYLKVLYLELKK